MLMTLIFAEGLFLLTLCNYSALWVYAAKAGLWTGLDYGLDSGLTVNFVFLMMGWRCGVVYIGVGSGGARGRGDSPPQVSSWGGASPPNFTHCLHNELHCSIVDRIACRHCSSRKSHYCCFKKMSPPQVRTSSYAYGV